MVVGVHAEEGERFIFKPGDERPLVGPIGPSRQSVLGPEVEQHDFAAVVAEFEGPAILVVPFNVGQSARIPAH